MDFSTLSANKWAMVSFPLPSALATASANGACHVDWIVNSNGTDSEFVFDRMGFSSIENWEDEASIALTSAGGAVGYSDTAWTAGTWRTEEALDSNWIVIPVVSGKTDSMQIQIEDSLGRDLYGTWEAKTADGSWSMADSLVMGDTASLVSFRLPATPLLVRVHLVTPQDPSQCPVDSLSGNPVCTGIPIETAKILWDYVMPGEDEDLKGTP